MGARLEPRYNVCIWGRIAPDAALGTIDVTQPFTERRAAERFAHEIAKHLPSGVESGGCVLAWVLVFALPRRPSPDNLIPGHCYLSFDPGGLLVKRHQILPGHWGHGARMRTVHAGGAHA